MIEILFPIILMIIGIVVPYLVFTKYYNHVRKHHKGFSDEETFEEATIFGFGFMVSACFPLGLITLMHVI